MRIITDSANEEYQMEIVEIGGEINIYIHDQGGERTQLSTIVINVDDVEENVKVGYWNEGGNKKVFEGSFHLN